jgi:hypothetical protein
VQVGSKTTFRMLNRLWTAHYANGRFERMNLPMERGVTFVVRPTTNLCVRSALVKDTQRLASSPGSNCSQPSPRDRLSLPPSGRTW